ncbi:hypothetical protein SAMD00019534_003750 [Acytostelium subglobosum LB1]|uniref:hypothetical protein n=1 Tax=Acytostelium subglobosum LB1 TaxID=1410327 RepID=UPI000644BF52|nr:hypothetical protein SAMD00019534_003750 [Acytostelium subglobosum LB1]GAM17200.1 hypothetical protein SAMD00019534_003750 [Acytostelium subglobosum LB1]|eukprot:XP_012759262.1 hypothetical protein SAMD00019534_003750 [Acytostelium subglobosum LB1]
MSDDESMTLSEDISLSESLHQQQCNVIARLVTLNPSCQHIPHMIEMKDGVQYIVGRRPQSDIVLQDKRISSLHCKLSQNILDSKFYIDDYSKNGIFVNGKRVGKGTTVQLEHGCIVGFIPQGAMDFIFQDLSINSSIIQSSPQPAVTIDDVFQSSSSSSAIDSSFVVIDSVFANVSSSPSIVLPSLQELFPYPSISTTSTSSTTNNNSGADTSSDSIVAQSLNELGALEENLMCGICQDILHKCITLVPCMHNFCVSCYGDWNEKSDVCPQCRCDVQMAQKNHAINNVVESYLSMYPEKKRDPEELANMDAKCKITEDMLKNGQLVKKKAKHYHHSIFNVQPMIVQCQNCTTPMPDGFTCPEGSRHHVCGSCHQLFPFRVPSPVKDKCDLCARPFCGNYRNCSANVMIKVDLLKNQTLVNIPHNAFSGNQFEVKVMNDYVVKSQKNVNQIYHEVLADIESGKIPKESIVTTTGATVSSDSWACYHCTSSVFGQALFTFRKNLAKDQLPDYAQTREDCYYGKNCRTQFNKFDHAKRLNHVCEQSKFSADN